MTDYSFLQPLENEQIRMFDDNGKIKGKYINLYKGLIVKNPYNGEIVRVPKTPENCNNHLKIKHSIENKVYFSNFCNLKTNYSEYQKLKKGEKIGEVSDDNLVYWITDENKETQKLRSFFDGTYISPDSKKEKKPEEKKPEEKKSEEQKKEKKEKPKKEKTITSTDDYPKTGGKVTKDSPFLFADIVTSPIALLGKALKEDVERIKELMK